MNSGNHAEYDPGDSGNAIYGSSQPADRFNRRESGTYAANTSPPNLDMDFGLAAPLKDPATFSYDDPLLYEHLQMSENANTTEPPIFPSQARVGGENNRPFSPAWPSSDWNMPGGFEPSPEDAMDVDSAASFVPSVYYDQMPELRVGNSLNDESEYVPANGYDHRFQFSANTPANTNSNVANNEFANMYSSKNSHSLDVDQTGSYISEDISPDHSNSGVYSHQNLATAATFTNSQDSPSLYRSASDFSHTYESRGNEQTSYREMDYHNMYPAELGEMEMADHKDTASHRTSISAALNELSPLTTTTSFTPSATSLHSTQPSFFSAQQYLRSSIDQSSLTRASIDFYQRRRPSVESENSGPQLPQLPVRSQRSLASYFHFRDRDRDRDRDRKSPMSRGPSPASGEWMQQLSQPRHSIRSIFKTNNGPAAAPDSTIEASDVYAMNHGSGSALDAGPGPGPDSRTLPPSSISQGSDEMAYGDIDGGVAKKNKRSKRNLFTRFKPSKTQDLLESKPELNDELSRAESDGELMEGTTISAPTSKGNTSASLHHIDSAGSAVVEQSREPDYASLFTGVGKRRNLVSKKSKKKSDTIMSRTDSEIKLETESDRVALDPSVSSTENSGDCVSANSVPRSSNSLHSKDDQPLSSGPSAFANASKRILGSRLMKKKPAVSKTEPSSSDVVEIDLQSLDLPVNTEIFSSPKIQTKIRGRKEDKAADMVDQSKIYVCGYCDRRFKRQEHLKRHFRSLHTAEKPYDCPICDKKFSRTDNLNQHLKVHKLEEEERAAAAAAAEAEATSATNEGT